MDSKEYEEYRNRPDYGIIHVGGGDKLLQASEYTIYGSMVHV
ncbi:MAG TPA: hypothetical protein ACHBX0_02395 [Arsenophonus sp.]